MPHRTGASHALAALAATVFASYLKDALQYLVSTRELVAYLNLVVGQYVERFGIAAPPDPVVSGGTIALVVGLTFLWGVAYHWRVIG
ncbi:hypothetical protein DVK02_06225 [Halobellus sp. Atlit-31R]|nr:hypothetical protein DVK02_06225 [Halobellus sp. Atlit-31R]